MQATDYEPLAPGVVRNPYPYYEVLRETAPVHWLESLRAHVLSRYEDIAAVIKNPAVFSSSSKVFTATLADAFALLDEGVARTYRAANLLALDPPLHTRVRGLVNRAFSPRLVASLEPRIREITRELLGQLPASGEFDLLPALAEPLPVIVIAELLGAEPARRLDFKRWSDDSTASMVAVRSGGDLTAIVRSQREMNLYMESLLEARRKAPREDLISALIQSSASEHPLSLDELLSFCRLLLVAGNETTTNLLGNGLNALLRHPEQQERLVREPGLIPNAVEEMLRYDSPIQAISRQVLEDAEVAGTRIPAGGYLIGLLGSANRDPRKFADPDRFDVTREVQGQLSFGHGLHFCLGAPLARLEARVVLEELLVPDRRLAFAPSQPREVEWAANHILRGPRSLRLKWEPRGERARGADR